MKVLLLNQCFYPDVVATAQYLTDLALALAEKGHSVTVVASSRGYDDPRLRFSKREVWKNISIIRVPTLPLGKRSRWHRALEFASFYISAIFVLLRLSKVDVVLAMTSPPLVSLLGALFVQLKGGRFVFWAMDLNPDEAIAAGWLKKGSIPARVLEGVLLYSMRRADKIIALDRFMRERLLVKGIPDAKLSVIPPWAHADASKFDLVGREAFRARHGLANKYVVMYSGNHSPCHPLDSLLGAAVRLAENTSIVFCFVGGGSELDKVKTFSEKNKLENVICLSYQPRNKLAGSLSAADLHVVVMGNPFVGIIHPSKIYNVLGMGLPFLYIGPPSSHIADILRRLEDRGIAGAARHGDVDGIVSQITERAGLKSSLAEPHPTEIASDFSKEVLLTRLLGILESKCNARLLPIEVHLVPEQEPRSAEGRMIH